MISFVSYIHTWKDRTFQQRNKIKNQLEVVELKKCNNYNENLLMEGEVKLPVNELEDKIE